MYGNLCGGQARKIHPTVRWLSRTSTVDYPYYRLINRLLAEPEGHMLNSKTYKFGSIPMAYAQILVDYSHHRSSGRIPRPRVICEAYSISCALTESGAGTVKFGEGLAISRLPADFRAAPQLLSAGLRSKSITPIVPGRETYKHRFHSVVSSQFSHEN